MKKFLMTLLLSILIVIPAKAQERGTAEEALALVEQGLAHIQAVGPEQAYADFMDKEKEFIKKDLYLFVVKMDGITLSHGGNPILVGRDVFTLRDADGKYFMRDFAAAAASEAGEGWVDYKWSNPTTQMVEDKASFIKKVDDNSFIGCGIYK